MGNENTYTDFIIGDVGPFYIFLAIAFVLTGWWVIKSKAPNKIELFFLSFYLMTGNVNEILTIEIPGFDLFEIQPGRFLFFLFSFFLFRKLIFYRNKEKEEKAYNTPLFQVFLVLYIVYIIISQFSHFPEVPLPDIILEVLFAITFIVFILSIKLFLDKESIKVLGKTIVTAAVFSSIIGFYQIAIDPTFMRIGDFRIAFGEIIRSNGIFSTEYFNSYFLILATVWSLMTVKKDYLKILLLILFTAGVVCSFHRMSWLVLLIVLGSYFVFIERVALEKLVLVGLVLAGVVLSAGIVFYDNIMNSQFVAERLSEPIDSRYGYYGMVINNIGEKPVFGFGGRKNDVYYYNMLNITKSRKRATGEEGSIHNGYLESMFYYGIPGVALFILFLGSTFIYFFYYMSKDMFFSIPLLAVFIFMAANFTNTFAFSSYLSTLLAIQVGIGLAYKRTRLLE